MKNFNGTTDKGVCGSGTNLDDIPGASGGLSTFHWFYQDAETNDRQFDKGEFDATSPGYWSVLLAGSGGTIGCKFQVKWSTTQGDWTLTANEFNDATLSTIGIKYAATATTADPTFYANGAKKIVGSGLTENTTPAGTYQTDASDNLIIGNDKDGARGFDGQLGFQTLWRGVQLSDNDYLMLSRGADPWGFYTDKIVLYLPMFAEQTAVVDYSAKAGMTNNQVTLTGTSNTWNKGAPVAPMWWGV